MTEPKIEDDELVPVVIHTDRVMLALWETARGLEPAALSWARIASATVIDDGETAVTVLIAEGHRAYLEAVLGADLIASALEEEIRVSASEVCEPVMLQEDYLLIPDCAENSLMAGGLSITISIEDAVELHAIIRQSEGDVGRIGLFRLESCAKDTARVRICLPPALMGRLQAAYSAEDRERDPAAAVMMTVLDAWRDEQGKADCVADDGDDRIPF